MTDSAARILQLRAELEQHNHGYYVLDEPTAHAIASMATQQDRETMQAFAAVASAFVFDGSIIG